MTSATLFFSEPQFSHLSKERGVYPHYASLWLLPTHWELEGKGLRDTVGEGRSSDT